MARSGADGILRAYLAQELNLTAVNVHYYLRTLLVKRYLSVTSVRYKNAGGQLVSNSAMLHIRKYAPDMWYRGQQVCASCKVPARIDSGASTDSIYNASDCYFSVQSVIMLTTFTERGRLINGNCLTRGQGPRDPSVHFYARSTSYQKSDITRRTR